jgi:riboflavin synthase
MFTGLIQRVGTLAAVKARSDGASLSIRHDAWESPLVIGESVAVQGACLTVTTIHGAQFTCDVLKETLNKTNLGTKRVGGPLNLERALRADERLGGHIVSGHIDGQGVVKSLTQTGDDWVLEVACDETLLSGMVSKGSVAIDGVSLTIADLRPRSFTVHLIPHTWRQTSLNALKTGHSVNLENDIIGKYVQRYLEKTRPAQGVTMERLHAAGFGGNG